MRGIRGIKTSYLKTLPKLKTTTILNLSFRK